MSGKRKIKKIMSLGKERSTGGTNGNIYKGKGGGNRGPIRNPKRTCDSNLGVTSEY
jgi:hypothetical protein